VVAAPLAVAVGETVPHGAGEHDTTQVTPLLAMSFVTVAVNCAVPPAGTEDALCVTETDIPGMVMVPELNTEELLTEVAVNVTCKSFIG
jgi:citrate lyase beta subunit